MIASGDNSACEWPSSCIVYYRSKIRLLISNFYFKATIFVYGKLFEPPKCFSIFSIHYSTQFSKKGLSPRRCYPISRTIQILKLYRFHSEQFTPLLMNFFSIMRHSYSELTLIKPSTILYMYSIGLSALSALIFSI